MGRDLRAETGQRNTPEAFTTGEVAQLCGVTRLTVARWLDAGKLKGFRIPGSTHRRIRKRDLAEFLRAQNLPLGALEDYRMLRLAGYGLMTGLAREFDALIRQTPVDTEWTNTGQSFDIAVSVAQQPLDVLFVDLAYGRTLGTQLAREVKGCKGSAIIVGFHASDEPNLKALKCPQGPFDRLAPLQQAAQVLEAVLEEVGRRKHFLAEPAPPETGIAH